MVAWPDKSCVPWALIPRLLKLVGTCRWLWALEWPPSTLASVAVGNNLLYMIVGMRWSLWWERSVHRRQFQGLAQSSRLLGKCQCPVLWLVLTRCSQWEFGLKSSIITGLWVVQEHPKWMWLMSCSTFYYSFLLLLMMSVEKLAQLLFSVLLLNLHLEDIG